MTDLTADGAGRMPGREPATEPSTGPTRAARPRLLVAVARSRQGTIGLLLLALVGLVALLGPLVAPHSPTAIGLAAPFGPPTADNLLGTDSLGRDVLSRFLHGGRSLLLLSAATTALAFTVGAVVGMVAGYSRGLVDQVISRVIDILISLPPLLIVLLLVAALGTSTAVLVVVVALFSSPRVARIVRGATQAVIANDYIAAARSRGESTPSVIVREVLPNISGPLLAELTLRFTYIVIFITTLNFLGLGVQPPTPDWGLMVSEGRILLAQAPLAALVPALGIIALGVGANLISDQIAVHLSPEVADVAEL